MDRSERQDASMPVGGTTAPPRRPVPPVAPPGTKPRPPVAPPNRARSAKFVLPALVAETGSEAGTGTGTASESGQDYGLGMRTATSRDAPHLQPPPTATARHARSLRHGQFESSSSGAPTDGTPQDGSQTPRLAHPSTARPSAHARLWADGLSAPRRPPGTPPARRAVGSRVPHDFGRQSQSQRKRRSSASVRGRQSTRGSGSSAFVFGAPGSKGARGSRRSGSKSPGSMSSQGSDFSAQFAGSSSSGALKRFQNSGADYARGRGRKGIASADISRPRMTPSPRGRRRRGSAQEQGAGVFAGIAVRTARSRSPLATSRGFERQRRPSLASDAGFSRLTGASAGTGTGTGTGGEGGLGLGLEALLRAQDYTEHRDFLRAGDGPVSRSRLRGDKRESRVIRALEEGNADDISTALTGIRSGDTDEA